MTISAMNASQKWLEPAAYAAMKAAHPIAIDPHTNGFRFSDRSERYPTTNMEMTARK